MNRADKRRKFAAGEVDVLQKRAFLHGQNWATECIYASTLLILHDKYNFEPKQCQEFLNHVTEQVECIRSGLVSYQDIIKTIKDELDIEITN